MSRSAEETLEPRIAFSVILARQGRRGILFAVATQIYGISLYITVPGHCNMGSARTFTAWKLKIG